MNYAFPILVDQLGHSPKITVKFECEKLKNWIKILLINIGVLILIFVLAEIGLRTYSTVKSCLTGQCDGSLWTRLNFFHENRMLGLTTHGPVLGYKPNPGFSGIHSSSTVLG